MEQLDQVTMLVQISYTIFAFVFTLLYISVFFIPQIHRAIRVRSYMKNEIIFNIKFLRYVYNLAKNKR